MLVDAKRGDMGNTIKAYAGAIFEVIGADAVTLHPYLGGDAIAVPKRADRGASPLSYLEYRSGRITAPAAANEDGEEEPLYLEVARPVAGVEYERQLRAGGWRDVSRRAKEVRQAAGDLPMLMPGIGAQGGDLEAVGQCRAG